MTDADHPYSQTHVNFDDKFSENQDKLILSRLKHRRGYAIFECRLSRDFQRIIQSNNTRPDTAESLCTKFQISNENAFTS